MRIEIRYKDIVKTLFAYFMVIYIFDLLWRYQGLVISSGNWGIVQTIAGMIVGLYVISLAVAGIVWIIGRGINKEIYFTIISMIFFAFICVFMVTINFRWLIQWYSIPAGIYEKLSFLLILVLLIAAFKYHKHLNNIFYKHIHSYFRLFFILLLVSTVISGYSLIGHLIESRGKNIENAQVVKVENAKPNIVLITIDALTYKALSGHGGEKGLTANMDKFARQSYVFENMHSNGGNTASSLSSIFLSKYPWTHRCFYFNSQIDLSKNDKNLIVALNRAGYDTAALVYPFRLGRYFQYIGLLDDYRYKTFNVNIRKYNYNMANNLDVIFRSIFGIKTYYAEMAEDYILRRLSIIDAYKYREDSAENIVAMAKEYLNQNHGPFFLWLHIYSPHEYGKSRPPKKFREISTKSVKGSAQANYIELIHYTDNYYGILMDYFKKMGLYDRSIIVLTADHGIAIKPQNANNPIPESVSHVPYIIHMPGQSQGARIAAFAEQVDIAPTILECSKINIPDWTEGESLKRYFNGGSTNKPKYSMIISGMNQSEGHKGAIAVYKDKYKLIYNLETGENYLYDLMTDPDEGRDISRENVSITADMNKLIIDKLDKLTEGGDVL